QMLDTVFTAVDAPEPPVVGLHLESGEVSEVVVVQVSDFARDLVEVSVVITVAMVVRLAVLWWTWSMLPVTAATRQNDRGVPTKTHQPACHLVDVATEDRVPPRFNGNCLLDPSQDRQAAALLVEQCVPRANRDG